MILQLFLLLPAGYIIFKAIREIYYLLDKLDDNAMRNYTYFKSLLQKYDTDYKFINTHINNINGKLDSLKLKACNIIGEINRMKYSMDDIYRIEDTHNLQNTERIKNTNDKIEGIDEDMRIMKNIYSITIGELKDEFTSIYKSLHDTFVAEKLSNDLAFKNVLNKINENNTNEYTIRFNNINQIIKETNINNIGTNYYFVVSKSNYRNIDKEYKTCNYRCNNILNYKLSIMKENDNIIITRANNNYILINISYDFSLTFHNNTLIGSSHDICHIVPNHDIDNEYPKFLKENEMVEYQQMLDLLNNNYETVKILINKFVKKELDSISLEPLINNFLI